jgi:CxxC-x17-CxxC domain-containing protein
MSFQDKTLTCSDCDKSFTFTIAEQEDFQKKAYTNDPKRCPECRQARKNDRISKGGNNFNNNFGTGGNSYNGNRSTGYVPGRQMFPAVCSECNKETSVPFEPRQGRPVYCSDCFRKVRATR